MSQNPKSQSMFNRRLGTLVVLLSLALLAGDRTSPAAVSSAAASASSVPFSGAEILWDVWGVPHLFAKDHQALFRAFGWAQMRSHGDLILRLYGQGRGRAAEYWGPQYLDSDRWVRLNGIPARAREWYQAQSPVFRPCLDAFVEGINAYARAHGDQIADEVKVVLPVSAVDLLAHAQRAIHFTFVTRADLVRGAARQWESGGESGAASRNGSNAWAIAPARAAGKHAMLLANPHLPWADLFLFYEAQFVAPGVNLYGATLVGFPAPGIAFNDYLGWSHTVNTHDGQDLYELELTAGGYRWDGKVRAFETEVQTIKVKRADGSMQSDQLTVRRSVHGPVVAEKEGRALALRIVGLDRPGLLEEWWDMGRARNLKEFEAVLRRLQLPMFTVMYADRDGHLMHLFGGLTPVRAGGPYDWAGIVPGDRSETLWTKTHSYDELPRVIDPPSGWLQNANDPPWTTTFPPALDPSRFPPYMAPRFFPFRAQRSARMLEEDRQITFEELIKYKHSTRMEAADRILDDLIAAARESDHREVKQAAETLAAWDRCADAASRGAVLFESFFRELTRRSGAAGPFAVPWNESAPRTTPRGLADPAVAVEALEAAVRQVSAAFGSADVAWGEVARLRAGRLDLPANGGPDELGIFRVVEFAPADDRHLRGISGDSYVAAIEFSNPVRARVLIGYGNSSQPGSPHLTDQLPLFARQELRPVWRTRAEIMAHLEARETF
ncbi:MAG TPA: acylase [Blastocatellia bacterium]|nr:acylase [Blastocatellia bacterium]